MNMINQIPDNIVPVLKALGDDTRAKIFEMLKGGELCACKILEGLNITQPTPLPPYEDFVRLRAGDCKKRLEVDALLNRQKHA